MVPSDCSPTGVNPYQILLSQALVAQGISLDNWPYYEGRFPIFRAAIARKKSFDVIHLQWIYCYLVGQNKYQYFFSCIRLILDIWIARLAGLKIVWTVHDYISHDSKFPGLDLWVRRQLVKLVDRVISLNQNNLETIANNYKFNPSKATVTLHGHYRDFYQSPVELREARKELGLPESGILYLNFGVLRPYKGIENLLQVWRENQDFFADDTLLIVGKPVDDSYVEKLKKLAKETRGVIIYSEFIENSKLHLYYSAANVVVSPFKKILNSGSFILAMSFGKPVIAPSFSGLLEMAGDAGKLLYDPDDEKGLLKAMQKSKQIDLDELSQLVVKACDRLDWNLIGQQTVAVYQSVTRKVL